MFLLDLQVSERIEYLLDMISCAGRMYYWAYDNNGVLLDTNCPDPVLDKVFSSSGSLSAVITHGGSRDEPILFSIPHGLTWCASIEKNPDKNIEKIHVLGPVSTAELSSDSIREMIQSSAIPSGWRYKFTQILKRIPIVFTSDFMKYTLMLHYCVTGQKLTTTDIACVESNKGVSGSEQSPHKDRSITYMAEKALLRMVREGDISYKKALHDAASISRGARISGIGSLKQLQVTQIIFTTLCTRAAIEGGLSPEKAYSTGDAYIQNILDCKSIAKAVDIGHKMYDDFINLVHNVKSDSNLSPAIKKCCDYIDLHVEEKLTLPEIASYAGYAEYYLSRKFKSETGTSINNYIKKAKIEKAKTLLLASDASIQEICDRLNFGSRSFFAETFKELTGITPAAYRADNQSI